MTVPLTPLIEELFFLWHSHYEFFQKSLYTFEYRFEKDIRIFFNWEGNSYAVLELRQYFFIFLKNLSKYFLAGISMITN